MERAANSVTFAPTLAGTTSRFRWNSKSTVVLAGLLLLYLLLDFTRSRMKPLWFDELGTLDVVSQPTLFQMFRVEPGDGNPPLQYLLVRPCLHLFGANAFALRLPALLFVALAIVCLYVFVARRFGSTAGLLASTLLVFSPLADYGVEARPYGLLLGLEALLLVLWQHAAMTKGRRAGTLAGIAISVFALVITHPMGFFWAGVPLLAGEVCRWRRTRHIDKPLLLALVLGFSGFAITLYFGHATHQALVAQAGENHPAISMPSLYRLRKALREDGFLPAVFVLLLAGLFAWRKQPRNRNVECDQGYSAAPLHEWFAVAALALTPTLVYLFTRFVTHYFWSRYLLPGMLGWLLLAAMACGSVRKHWFTLAAIGVGVLLTLFDRRSLNQEKKPWPSGPPVSALLSHNASTEPIVIGSPLLFSQIWWYSPPVLRSRVRYIADAKEAVKTDDFIGDLTLISLQEAGSPMFAPDRLQTFFAANPRFLFWHGEVDNGDWLEPYLRSRRYTFTPMASDSTGATLFQVTKPAIE